MTKRVDYGREQSRLMDILEVNVPEDILAEIDEILQRETPEEEVEVIVTSQGTANA